MVSPYEVLQVDPDADEAAIEDAYRRRVKETHPDQGGSASEFRLVRLAYEELQRGEDGGPRSDVVDRPRPAGAPDPARTRATATVEYLNYEALDDLGWSLGDDDLFEKAAAADLGPRDYGELEVEHGESVLEAAEDDGFGWPFSCRGGACANCAVAVTSGELEMPVNTILPSEQLDRGIRLSCIGTPVTGDVQLVYNVKHLPGLEELHLPPRPFAQTGSDD